MNHERPAPSSIRVWSVFGVLAASALFGTTGTALAQVSGEVDPLSAGILRLLIGGIGLLCLSISDLASLRRHPLVVLAGCVGVAVYQLAFFWSTRSTGVAMASVVTIGTSPIASFIIGRLRGRPRPSTSWFVAALVIIGGLTTLVTGGYQSIDVVPRGVLAAILAGTAYAAYTESASILVGRNMKGTTVMAGLFLGAGILTSPALMWTGVDMLTTGRGVAVLLYLALITLTLAYVAFGWSLGHLPPTTVVMLTLLEPVVAAVLSVLVLHQTLSAAGWLGATIVCGGMFIAGASTRVDRTTVSA